MPTEAPVTALCEDHVTDFVASLIPDDIRSPEEVSQMRTAQTNLAAIRKFYSYLASYDLHPTLSTEKLRNRISAMMPRFTPPPPDVRTGDLDRIVEFVRNGQRETDATRELRRLEDQGDDLIPLSHRRARLGAVRRAAARHRFGEWRGLRLPS